MMTAIILAARSTACQRTDACCARGEPRIGRPPEKTARPEFSSAPRPQEGVDSFIGRQRRQEGEHDGRYALATCVGCFVLALSIPGARAQQRTLYQQTQYKGQEIGKLTGDIYYARMDWELYEQQRPGNVAGTYRALTSNR